jgi:thymidine kinase
MTKFNYEQKGYQTFLIKPATDTRDGKNFVKSRIGLAADAYALAPEERLDVDALAKNQVDVIICDEAQFLAPEQVEQLKDIAVFTDIPVICFGLKDDFQTKMFPGSKRLFELADSLKEVKTVCQCGRKATVNARLVDEKVVIEGEQVLLGGNEAYEAMCYECWKRS